MKTLLAATSCVVVASLSSGCVSAWMADSTGVTLKPGMDRAEVHSKLGAPFESIQGVPEDAPKFLTQIGVSVTDRHRFLGKVNYPQEGGGQATLSAMTLGAAEVILVPLTAADIATRSASESLVEVFYDAKHELVRFQVEQPDGEE